MMDTATTLEPPTHGAIASGPDGIRFIAFAASRDEVTRRLARYVRTRCEFTLWPEDAAVVKQLVAEGREADAVNEYYSRVGERWDPEFLERI